jgi:hypothetical protein
LYGKVVVVVAVVVVVIMQLFESFGCCGVSSGVCFLLVDCQYLMNRTMIYICLLSVSLLLLNDITMVKIVAFMT